MELIKYKNINMLLDTKSNHYGFIHTAIIFFQNCEKEKTAIQYYNRTWEVFDYETVINKLINIELEKIYNNYKETYKKENNIKRINKESEKAIKNLCKNSKYYMELKGLKNKIKKCTNLYQLQK